MNKYYEIKEMLCRELDSIADKGEMSAGDLDIVDKLTHSIKSIATIIAMDEGGYSGYSRRDSRGRYSRDGRYYRDEYSRDADQTRSKIEELMNESDDPKVREILRNAVSQMK